MGQFSTGVAGPAFLDERLGGNYTPRSLKSNANQPLRLYWGESPQNPKPKRGENSTAPLLRDSVKQPFQRLYWQDSFIAIDLQVYEAWTISTLRPSQFGKPENFQPRLRDCFAVVTTSAGSRRRLYKAGFLGTTVPLRKRPFSISATVVGV